MRGWGSSVVDAGMGCGRPGAGGGSGAGRDDCAVVAMGGGEAHVEGDVVLALGAEVEVKG